MKVKFEKCISPNIEYQQEYIFLKKNKKKIEILKLKVQQLK